MMSEQPSSLSAVSSRTVTPSVNFQSPLSFRKLWEGWKRTAHKIGDFQARLLLMIFYLFILGPFALLLRWRGDPMGIKSPGKPGWLQHVERAGEPLERARQQF
jgi:hypothetical protein